MKFAALLQEPVEAEVPWWRVPSSPPVNEEDILQFLNDSQPFITFWRNSIWVLKLSYVMLKKFDSGIEARKQTWFEPLKGCYWCRLTWPYIILKSPGRSGSTKHTCATSSLEPMVDVDQIQMIAFVYISITTYIIWLYNPKVKFYENMHLLMHLLDQCQ